MLPNQAPDALHELAFGANHVSVELPLVLTIVGLADKVTLGAGVAEGFVVGVEVGVAVVVAVRVGVAVGVEVGVAVRVEIGVTVRVEVGVAVGVEETDAGAELLLAVLPAPSPPPPQAAVHRGKVRIRKRCRTRERRAVSIISLMFIPIPDQPPARKFAKKGYATAVSSEWRDTNFLGIVVK